MAKLKIGDQFPSATLKDIDGETMEFPAVFGTAPATVIYAYLSTTRSSPMQRKNRRVMRPQPDKPVLQSGRQDFKPA